MRDGEVELRRATHEVRERRRDHARRRRRPRSTSPPRTCRCRRSPTGRPRRRVAADRGERRLRERELPGDAEHEVEADDEDGVEEPGVDEVRRRPARSAELAHQRRRRARNSAEPEVRRAPHRRRARRLGSAARRGCRPARGRRRGGGSTFAMAQSAPRRGATEEALGSERDHEQHQDERERSSL